MLVTKNYQEFHVLSEDGTLVKTFRGSANRCLPGDLVDLTEESVSLVKRNQPNTLVGTIHITSKYLFGHSSRNVPVYLFFPYDTSYPPFRVGCSSREGKNKIGLVTFESWDRGETYPRGILTQLLGSSGDPEAEELALKYTYAPQWKTITKLPKSSIERLPRDIEISSFTFNIDPPGCKDIDDCLTLEYNDSETYLYITIADLTDIVEEGSELDRVARNQGSTLYSPEGEAIAPMLPRWISEDSASLLPGQPRNGITLRVVWTGKELRDPQFMKTRITNTKSYTYDSIYENKEVCDTLTSIASYLEGSACNDSHKWIEHCMIYYNQQVAKQFLSSDPMCGFLRKLERVSVKRLEQKAAEYCATSEGAIHKGIQNSHYTHATSPIRRYADIVAQRYMNSYKKPDALLLYTMNDRMKKVASYQRDMCFFRQVSKSSCGIVEGTILDWTFNESKNMWKLYVECKEWKQIIHIHLKGYEETDTLYGVTPDEEESYCIQRDQVKTIRYYCDLTQPNWKKRLVFSLY